MTYARPVPGIGWRWVASDGRVGSSYASRTLAAEDALRVALAAKWDPKFPAETKAALWRSLKGKGWRVEWVGGDARPT